MRPARGDGSSNINNSNNRSVASADSSKPTSSHFAHDQASNEATIAKLRQEVQQKQKYIQHLEADMFHLQQLQQQQNPLCLNCQAEIACPLQQGKSPGVMEPEVHPKNHEDWTVGVKSENTMEKESYHGSYDDGDLQPMNGKPPASPLPSQQALTALKRSSAPNRIAAAKAQHATRRSTGVFNQGRHPPPLLGKDVVVSPQRMLSGITTASISENVKDKEASSRSRSNPKGHLETQPSFSWNNQGMREEPSRTPRGGSSGAENGLRNRNPTSPLEIHFSPQIVSDGQSPHSGNDAEYVAAKRSSRNSSNTQPESMSGSDVVSNSDTRSDHFSAGSQPRPLRSSCFAMNVYAFSGGNEEHSASSSSQRSKNQRNLRSSTDKSVDPPSPGKSASQEQLTTSRHHEMIEKQAKDKAKTSAPPDIALAPKHGDKISVIVRAGKGNSLSETKEVENLSASDAEGHGGLYTGSFSRITNFPDGLGVMKYSDGRTYYGDWNQGKWEGHGEFFDPTTGNEYKGNFAAHKKHGKGLAHFHGGNVFEGEFVKDAINNGIMCFPDGTKYVGMFSDQKRDGYGLYYFNEEETLYYEGQWSKDLATGHGRMDWPEGDYYVGQWENGAMHGQGLHKNADGTIRAEGTFHHGEPVPSMSGKKDRSSF